MYNNKENVTVILYKLENDSFQITITTFYFDKFSFKIKMNKGKIKVLLHSSPLSLTVLFSK